MNFIIGLFTYKAVRMALAISMNLALVVMLGVALSAVLSIFPPMPNILVQLWNYFGLTTCMNVVLAAHLVVAQIKFSRYLINAFINS